jgi:hypothetical protein
MNTEQKIKIMEAFINGYTIQCRACCDNRELAWNDVTKKPLWNWVHHDYRIKPKDKTILITAKELFTRGATHIDNSCGQIATISRFEIERNKIVMFGIGETDGGMYSINELHNHGYTWTSDRNTWNKFEANYD